jgi:hypothetical protein
MSIPHHQGAAPQLELNRVSWRKNLLLNRIALLTAWSRCFPRHDMLNLHLIGSSTIPAGWDAEAEAWRKAARDYHADRKASRR